MIQEFKLAIGKKSQLSFFIKLSKKKKVQREPPTESKKNSVASFPFFERLQFFSVSRFVYIYETARVNRRAFVKPSENCSLVRPTLFQPVNIFAKAKKKKRKG